MTTRKGAAAVAMAAVAVGAILTASTTASAAPAPGKATRDASVRATTAGAPALASHPCWTSFVPENPEGAAMDQYYKNCTDSPVTVCAKNLTDGYVAPSRTIGANDVAWWHWNSTTPGAHYTTIFC
ncbi:MULTISPECIES: hypothetical protein [Streptomyces]|uniref:Peptidase inhibitor family I36 n=1 Tax=Streptomyces yunnanensis TaxID=156453 RepID=A0ABY7ZZM6_9ACTN|nr:MULTISPECIES: hypothetical protein [Streptomyces]WEB38090.1 hypothetical protein MOV08_01370 [Streptomyces yunnanensis]